MTAVQLARQLKPFKITSKSIRRGSDSKKGYTRERFEDAFTRYAPLKDGRNGTTSQPNKDGASSDYRNVTLDSRVTDQNRLKPLPDNDCDDVTDQKSLEELFEETRI